jgi:hypothetical protein
VNVSQHARPGDPSLDHCWILYGWHEIAAYLRRSRATVHRWHKHRALPISIIGFTVVIPRSAVDLWVMNGATTRHAGPDGGPEVGG